MATTAGIHHITAISGEPKRNLAFYQDVLNLRLIKKTVNFDDPGTYHLYYGDTIGSPGTILTFFPWPNAKPGKSGAGESTGTSFIVPVGSLDWWMKRFEDRNIAHGQRQQRFGEATVAFHDPDGMSHLLVERDNPISNASPTDACSISGFGGITLRSLRPDRTGNVLSLMGFARGITEGSITRWHARSGSPVLGDVVDVEDASALPRGISGAGTIHHVAFRAADDEAQDAMRNALTAAGLGVTEQVDRNYFRSIYFREPGGTLFEIATDAPGFAVDEPLESLGQTLMLPAWLESRRTEIEAALPALR